MKNETKFLGFLTVKKINKSHTASQTLFQYDVNCK